MCPLVKIKQKDIPASAAVAGTKCSIRYICMWHCLSLGDFTSTCIWSDLLAFVRASSFLSLRALAHSVVLSSGSPRTALPPSLVAPPVPCSTAACGPSFGSGQDGFHSSRPKSSWWSQTTTRLPSGRRDARPNVRQITTKNNTMILGSFSNVPYSK